MMLRYIMTSSFLSFCFLSLCEYKKQTRLNPYVSISCIRFEGIISAHTVCFVLCVGTLLMFDCVQNYKE